MQMRGRGGLGEPEGDPSERGAGPRLPPGMQLPQRTMESFPTGGQRFPRPGPRGRQEGPARGDRAPRVPRDVSSPEDPELDLSGDEDDEKRQARRALERRRRELAAREALAAGGRDRKTEHGSRRCLPLLPLRVVNPSVVRPENGACRFGAFLINGSEPACWELMNKFRVWSFRPSGFCRSLGFLVLLGRRRGELHRAALEHDRVIVLDS